MIELLLVLVSVALVVACGFFVASEFAFVTVDRSSVDRDAEEGSRRAKGVREALKSLSTQLSAAQVGSRGASGTVTKAVIWDAGTLTVGAATGRADVVPAERCWTLTFLALLPAGPVTVDGAPREVTGHDGRWSVTTP